MPRGLDEAEDDWDMEEEVDDAPGDSGDATAPCPHCRRPVYDDAELCPSCGAYISREDDLHRKPWWLLIGVAICLYAVLRGIVRF